MGSADIARHTMEREPFVSRHNSQPVNTRTLGQCRLDTCNTQDIQQYLSSAGHPEDIDDYLEKCVVMKAWLAFAIKSCQPDRK